MPANIRTSFFGYNKRQVNEFISRMLSEHETALALKNERFIEIRDQNNIMKAELARYRSMEQEISSVLITARTTALELISEGERSAEAEKARLMDEINLLDKLAQAQYQRLENAAIQAADCVHGFEMELNELLERKEAFLKATYGFEREASADTLRFKA